LEFEVQAARLLTLVCLPDFLAGLLPFTSQFAIVRKVPFGGILARHTVHDHMVSSLNWSGLKGEREDETGRNRGKKKLIEHFISPN